MSVTASALRNDIYQLLDKVLETGEALEINRKGQILKILPAEPKKKLSNIVAHDVMTGDPEELVSMDWSGEWNSDLS